VFLIKENIVQTEVPREKSMCPYDPSGNSTDTPARNRVLVSSARRLKKRPSAGRTVSSKRSFKSYA